MQGSYSPDRLAAIKAELRRAPLPLFIGGSFEAAQSVEAFAVEDPATGAGGGRAARGSFDAGPWAQTKLARMIRAGGLRINGPGGADHPALPLGGFEQSRWGRKSGRLRR
jgi:acyl-CoA reductase-like NAD-dependent aldehyde dehydrogenase